jgi:cytokinin dehydrogenase
MSAQLSRRSFIRLAAASSGVLIAGFNPRTRSWVTNAQGSQKSLEELPRLDGALYFDDASLQAVATDVGHSVHHRPLAVLKPASVLDVMQMVRYANQHHLKIAMRGQGHSQYGQTLVEAGIVIDSSTLNAVKLIDVGSVDAQPGASWGEVNKVTLVEGRTPPVMGDTMTLSVGGILSVGGWGQRSHHYGAVVDNVTEFDVVTGDGRLITCSDRQNSELFNMVLAGLGQCGLIVRARLRLVPSTSHIVRQDLMYNDLETYLSDQKRLVADRRFDDLHGSAIRQSGGGWTFVISAGMFYTPPNEPDLAPLVAGLRFDSRADPTRVSYWEFLQRNAAGVAATKASAPRRSAAMAFFIPASTAKDFTARMLATPSETDGINRFGFTPLATARFTRPMFKLPDEDLAFSLWPRRYTAIDDLAGHAAMMKNVYAIYERMRAVGGKRYSPYSPIMSNADWKEHFGPMTWQRLAAAKGEFDPNNVLTPGPGIFR